MKLTAEDIAAIATAVVEQLEQRQRAALEAQARDVEQARAALLKRRAQERIKAEREAHVDPKRDVFADFDNTGYQKVRRAALKGQGLRLVGHRSGTNEDDGTPYSVGLYRKVH